MRNIVSLFILCILFQSCYSFKTFNQSPDETTVGELYKFDLTNGKEFQAQIDSIGENSLYLKKGDRIIQIPYSEIKVIETAEKSTGKTVGLISIIAAGAALVAAIVIAISNIGSNIGCCGDFPN